jgi:hypothetical protein
MIFPPDTIPLKVAYTNRQQNGTHSFNTSKSYCNPFFQNLHQQNSIKKEVPLKRQKASKAQLCN